MGDRLFYTSSLKNVLQLEEKGKPLKLVSNISKKIFLLFAVIGEL